ncbi:MAG: PAS domain S-box protein, partial [Methanolinea sp.]|nr:PAS domain S-box protein [Methanolinea sp.]
DLLEIARAFLEMSGEFKVATSTSAQDVLDSSSISSFDAIVSDYVMPGMDGIAFLKTVRKQFGEIPFILFTGRGREEVVIEAINHGADFYLQKGGDPGTQFAELAHQVRQAVFRKRAERSLRESEAFLNSIIEQSPHSMWISDSRGTLIRQNQACRTLIQATDEELVGRYNVFSDNLVEEQGYMPLVRKVFEHGETVSFPLVYDSANVKGLSLAHPVKRTLVITIFPIKDLEGRITNAVVQHIDLTRWKQAEDAWRDREKKYHLLADHTPDMIFRMTLPEGIYEYVSPASLTLTGYSPEEFYANPGLTHDLIHPAWREYLDHQMAALLKGDAPPIYEFQIIDRAGKTLWISQRNMLVTDDLGQPIAIEGIVTDITAQKETERELRISEQRFLAVIKNARSWIWEVDAEGIYRYSSPAIEQILGYLPEELVGRVHFYDLFDPTVREELKAVADAAFGRREPFRDFVNLNRHKNGTPVILKTSGTPICEEDGTFSGYCGVDEDITEQRRADETLRASEERFRGMAERSSDLILILDREMNPTYVSPSIRTILGYEPEEVLGIPHKQAISTIFSESAPDLPNIVETITNGLPVEDAELRIPRKNGDPAYFSLHAVPVLDNGVFSGAQVSLRDITARRQAELALSESEARYRLFIERFKGIAYLSRPDFMPIFIQGAVEEITGYSPEKIKSGHPRWDQLIHPEDMAGVIRRDNKKLLEIPGYHIQSEYRIVRKDGEVRWISDFIQNITDENGTLLLSGILTDVTERKTVERALLESETRFRSLVETSPNIIWEIDPGGRIRYVSPIVEKIMGFTQEELLGKAFMDLVPESDRSVLSEKLGRFIVSGESLVPFEVSARHRDGSDLVIEIRPARIIDNGGTLAGFRGVAQDITERKKAEEALRQAYRQLNLLTGITRHDILNKISVILGFLKIAEKKCEDPEHLNYLSKIESATTAIRSQIEFTRIYQDLGTRKPQWIDLDGVIARSQFPATIALSSSVRDILIFADPMLEKVFSNLLDNSIRHGGHVTEIRVSSCPQGEDRVVIWEDNGVGIAAGEKGRIFERGFGKHTGLGMFLTREILSLTGITIQETGVPGEGARFEITVPKGMFRVRTATP